MTGEAVAVPKTEAKPVVDPNATIDPKAVAKPAEPTRDITVNGKKVAVTDAQLIALAQKGHFADQKLKSMDVLVRSSGALIEKLKTPEGIMDVLKDPKLGTSPKDVFKKLMASDVIDDELKEEMSKWVYDNVVAQAKKTPEEIEREKKLTDYERLKKQEDDRKKSDAINQQNEKVQQIYQAVRSEVTKQILADKTFPQTEGSIRAVVEKLRVMNRQGAKITVENVTKALGLVKKDHLTHQTTILDALEDPEQLIAAIGEARALKISRALVARLKAKQKVAAKEEKASEPKPEKITDRLDKKYGRTPQGYHIMDVM